MQRWGHCQFLSALTYIVYNVFATQKGFLGLWGERVDSIDYYKQQIKDLDEQVSVPTSFRQHSFGFLCIQFLP